MLESRWTLDLPTRSTQNPCRTMPDKSYDSTRPEIQAQIDNLTASEIERQWQVVEDRMGRLVPILRDLRLGRTASETATAMGLRDAASLTRELARRQLPPYRLLRNWYLLVVCSERLETERSLCKVATNLADDPSKYYRLARVVTGRPWSQRRLGGRAALQRDALNAWRTYLGDV